MLHRHCFIPFLQAQVPTMQTQNTILRSMADGFNPVNASMGISHRRALMESDVCFTYGHVFEQMEFFFWTMFSSCALPFDRNEALCKRVVMGLKHSASDSSTISRIVIHSIYLKNQLKLSAIVTNQFFIANTINVYNNAV